MKSNNQSNNAIRNYLLGRSNSEEAAQVEESLLIDDEFYQELLVIEDELVDEYVAGQLTESEAQSFESHFLNTSERHEKLRFARNLKKYMARAVAETTPDTPVREPAPESPVLPKPRKATTWSWLLTRPIFSYSLAAAAVVVLAFAIVFVVTKLQPSQSSNGKALAVELAPGLSRGDEGTKPIMVTAETATVELQLRIPSELDYQAYRAVVQTSDGREISRQDNLRRDPASKDRINYSIRANLLTAGDYNLKLSGLNKQGEYEDAGRYSFRVSGR